MFKEANPSSALATLYFNTNTVITVGAGASGLSGCMGGIVYAINLLSFSASSNVMSKVLLTYGIGDFFYIKNNLVSKPSLTVALTSN